MQSAPRTRPPPSCPRNRRDEGGRLKASRVWIIDPLGAAKEFLAGKGEFSILVGLAVDGRPVLGVVYMPDGERMYTAAQACVRPWKSRTRSRRCARIETSGHRGWLARARTRTS